MAIVPMMAMMAMMVMMAMMAHARSRLQGGTHTLQGGKDVVGGRGY